MLNTMLCGRLPAPPMNSTLCYCKFSFTHPSNIPHSHLQTHFPQYALSRLKLPQTDITPMPKLEHGTEQSTHLFKKHGFTDLQIAKITRIMPHLIGCPEKILKPKLQLLEDFGFVDQNLSKLLIRNPRVLNLSFNRNLPSKLEFLKDVFQSDDVLVRTLLRNPRVIGFNLEKTLKPSIAFWERWGFSGTELVTFLKLHPALLTMTSLIPAKVDLINKIGADKKSKKYKYIVTFVATSRVETSEAKVENLKHCGLSAEETWQLIRSCPEILYHSKETVSLAMYFVVTNMELPANCVVKHPFLMRINLEKTIKPRFLVWQKIKSIDGYELPLISVLRMTETRFVDKIIKEHPESKLLWTIYENAISNASNRTKTWTKATSLLKNKNPLHQQG